MAAPTETFPEVLTEGWLWWLSDKELRKSKNVVTASGWKPFYFYITISHSKTHINLYKKPPKSRKEKPYVTHTYPEFQLHKKTETKFYQPFMCDVIDSSRRASHYSFENEARRDSFAFFMITQRRLPEPPIYGKVFTVNPDDSDEHRKIGSRGSVCLLHVCKSGLTLAFQISHSIVAQWPLNSIRNYETVGVGCFKMEAGRRAPMGQGVYRFKTKEQEDQVIYHMVDRYINETLKDSQRSKVREEKIYEEYCDLGVLTTVQSDSRHSQHLKRVSANNFNLNPLPVVESTSLPSSTLYLANPTFSEQKISDIEEWLQGDIDASTASRGSAIPSRGNVSMSSNSGTPTKGPKVPESRRPGWNKPISIKRGRSKTSEDPLSLPSIDPTNYLDMSVSMHSLNIVGQSAGSSTQSKHSTLAKSDKLLDYRISMSPDSVSRSFDLAEGRRRDKPSKLQLQNSQESSSLSVFSPSSQATPPPSFYEAMGFSEAMPLPAYPAPTPPEETGVFIRAHRGGNLLSLPPRKRGARGSAGSCEDLTELVRNSLIVSPSEEQNEYANAMFHNELLQDFETSADHAKSKMAVMSSETGDAPDIVTTATHVPVQYCLADVIDDGETSDKSSPRVNSTYLYDNGKPISGISLRDGDSTELDSSQHITDQSMTSPPPIADIPRPYRLHSTDTSNISPINSYSTTPKTAMAANSNNFHISGSSPTKDDSMLKLSEAQMVNRPLPVPKGDMAGCRDTFRYEQVNYGSATESAEVVGDNGAYELINNIPVRKKSEGTEAELNRHTTTVWHVTLDGDPVDNPLPDVINPIPVCNDEREARLSDAVAAFNNVEKECDLVNSGASKEAEFTSSEDADGYLMAAISPPNAVRLPLPPANAGEDSDEEKRANWSGFGSVRKIFSEFSKNRLRRTKSTDVLSDGVSEQSPSNKKPSIHSTRATRLSSKKAKGGKSSSAQVNEEFTFIRPSAQTKVFSRAGAQSTQH